MVHVFEGLVGGACVGDDGFGVDLESIVSCCLVGAGGGIGMGWMDELHMHHLAQVYSAVPTAHYLPHSVPLMLATEAPQGV